MVSKKVVELRNLFMKWSRDEIKTEDFTQAIRQADGEDVLLLLAALNGVFQAKPELNIEIV